MAKRIAVSNLNASTVDILNTIRANADSEYQSLVPVVKEAIDIPRVGEVLYGYPAIANKFLNALVNRIALVRVKSAVFNNAYAQLKKGFLEFGETVEEVFVNISKAREFSAEKAEARELKRTLPDVRSAFHTMNWRVQYPVTIQDMDLRQAFMNMEGVQDLIARIVDSVYTAAEYDEYLLFKYLIIKGIANGKMYPVAFDGTNMKNAAVSFRGMSNQLTFMSAKYNAEGVTTTTPKYDQFIFMDAMYNASYDVEVLASAFNMDKADFMGRLLLIDSFTDFDNDRFSEIQSATDVLPPVTPAELAIMANVKAVLVDREWFQVYDNQANFTEKYVAAGSYWNYFYNVWKTISYSPFSNAIVFVDQPGAVVAWPAIEVEIVGKDTGIGGTVFALGVTGGLTGLASTSLSYQETEEAVQGGIAVQRYGSVTIPPAGGSYTVTASIYDGQYTYVGTAITPDSKVGDKVTLTLQTQTPAKS